MVVRRCFAFVFLGTAVSPSGVSSCGCFQIWVGGVLRAVLCTTIEPFSLRCASLPTLLPANVLSVGSGGSWVLVVVGTRLGSPCLVGGVWFPLAILCVCVCRGCFGGCRSRRGSGAFVLVFVCFLSFCRLLVLFVSVGSSSVLLVCIVSSCLFVGLWLCVRIVFCQRTRVEAV